MPLHWPLLLPLHWPLLLTWPLPLRLRLRLRLLLPLPLGSPSVYRRGVGARSGKRCGVCLSVAQRSEFSRAPLRAPTTRGPRAAGRHSRGRLFLPIFFWRSKKSRSPAGANTRPGHDGSAVVLRHPPRRRHCEAAVAFAVCRLTSTSTTMVLPVPCRVMQRRCTAVEASRDSVPAAGSLFLLRQKK